MDPADETAGQLLRARLDDHRALWPAGALSTATAGELVHRAVASCGDEPGPGRWGGRYCNSELCPVDDPLVVLLRRYERAV